MAFDVTKSINNQLPFIPFDSIVKQKIVSDIFGTSFAGDTATIHFVNQPTQQDLDTFDFIVNTPTIPITVDSNLATITIDSPTEVYDVYWYTGVGYSDEQLNQPTLDNVDPTFEIQDEQGNPIIGKHLVIIIGQTSGEFAYAEIEVTNA